MSENKIGFALVHEICPICGKPMIYLKGCERDFEEYHMLVDKYKINRQDARGKLPIDTATKCIYTYSINEWKHIIKLRSDSAAHPNAQIISNMIKKELESLGYEFN